jgi:hypothetical protein
VQYHVSSVSFPVGPKNPYKGTSMKFLVRAFGRPVPGYVLGVKEVGRSAMACGRGPYSAEA